MKRIIANRWIRFKRVWIPFWMRRSSLKFSGRIAMRLATWLAPNYKSRVYLAKMGPVGYISPSAIIEHTKLQLTADVYLGDRTTVFESSGGGSITLNQGVHLYSDTIMETGAEGRISIDEETHIQPRCSLSAYKGSIVIGKRVEIAPNCAFYPYNHAIEPDQLIRDQPLVSKGDIIIEDDVWLGVGVIVLEGVTVGKGAVVGAGSVVTKNIPSMAIAVGSPAKIIGNRNDINKTNG